MQKEANAQKLAMQKKMQAMKPKAKPNADKWILSRNTTKTR
jgi:hypothetical protein